MRHIRSWAPAFLCADSSILIASLGGSPKHPPIYQELFTQAGDLNRRRKSDLALLPWIPGLDTNK
jgi:hypothetical protein